MLPRQSALKNYVVAHGLQEEQEVTGQYACSKGSQEGVGSKQGAGLVELYISVGISTSFLGKLPSLQPTLWF